MKKLIAFLIITSFTTVTLAQDKPVISPLQKGQQAPFSGVLLNDVAVADIVTQKEAQEKKCDATIEMAKTEEKVKCQYSLNVIKIDAGAEKKALEARVNALLSSNDSLVKRAIDAEKKVVESKKDDTFWFAGGIVSGVLLGVLSTYFIVSK